MRKLIGSVAIVCCFAGAAAGHAACRSLYVKGDQLWVSSEGEAAFVLSDALGIERAHWSPDGSRVVYVRRFQPRKDHLTDIVVADMRAMSTKVIATLTWEDSVKAVVQTGWRGKDAVWIEGHVNPSTNIYYEWDVAIGERTRDLPGSRFSWSPDGKHLAYVEHRAHFTPDASRPATLMIDEEGVYTLSAGDRIASSLEWSPDSASIRFVTTNGHEAKSRVVDANDKAERSSVPVQIDREVNKVRPGVRVGAETFPIMDELCETPAIR